MVPLTSGLFTWRWGPQVGEVTFGGLPHLSCKRDHIKMRDYMDRQVIPPHLSGVPHLHVLTGPKSRKTSGLSGKQN